MCHLMQHTCTGMWCSSRMGCPMAETNSMGHLLQSTAVFITSVHELDDGSMKYSSNTCR